MRLLKLAAITLAGLSIAVAADRPVTITQEGNAFTLSNGIVTAKINKTTGDLMSLQYRGLETMGHGSGHPAGYWEQTPAKATRLAATLTIDPATNGGARGEVSIKGESGGKALDGGGQPGGSTLCDLEIRYTMARGESGVYTYAIFTHQPTYPATQIGESRFGAKLNAKVFDWMSIDARRNKLMPTGEDWDKGALLNMKEARRLTTGTYAGQVEHKYDYSALQFDIPAFGWSSTKEHIGLYFINPSMEYLSGGATKVELTGHLDNGAGGDPTLLDYWRGTHYGGSELRIAAGEDWSKVVGPILVYLDSAPDPNAMYKDALAQAAKESAKWPYDWVQGADYPKKSRRGEVTGQLALNDPQAKSLPNLLVGLAFPDAPPRGSWQNDAKHYEFWVRGAADGRFTIPNVRPGTYQLHAIADGVLGEYQKADVTVEPGGKVNLGKLEWKPVRYGKQIWEIGVPNRSGAEFFKGDDYFHWGWYLEYPRLFPNDVTYTIGQSDYRRDWFFEQVPRADQPDPTGRGTGRATTWTINFTLPQDLKGQATLRLALAGVSARSIDVSVNDQPAGTVSGLVYNATINRDGIQGSWVEKDVTFDASLMKEGRNVLKLTIPAGGLTSGIIYDYLRLEVAQ
ncbi:MAG: polysaccharide lyase family protein [Candidatus Sulfopaludibacter sp.]|nr:polysaccharide lyase family protein [Candidatus Sulfopaludibacter sp.]